MFSLKRKTKIGKDLGRRGVAACTIFIATEDRNDWLLAALEISVWCETVLPNGYTMDVYYDDEFRGIELKFHTQNASDTFDAAYREAEAT